MRLSPQPWALPLRVNVHAPDIVLSPVKAAARLLLPPKGAAYYQLRADITRQFIEARFRINARPLRGYVHAPDIVLSPVKAAKRLLLPPEGAWAFPLRCFAAFLHLTYAYAPGFARCLRRCESPAIACTNLLRRFRIVSSPGFSLWLNPAPKGGGLP